MFISWLPHAGQTELTQVALAIWGMYANCRLLLEVSIDAVVARRDDRSADTDAMGRAAVRHQVVLALIQFIVLATGMLSLMLPPPPPARFSEMWLSLDPRAVMWVVQHLGLILTTILCVVGAHLAVRERQRILRPQRAQQRARRAVYAAEDTLPGAPLFQQIGGGVALDGIVADLYARLLRDPVLAPYFSGINVKRLAHAQASMMSALLGGGTSAVDLRDAHAHLAIPDAHFTRLAEHLRDSLQFFGVAPALRDQVLAMVESTRPQIVTMRPSVDGPEAA